MQPRPTLVDIAEILGVHQSTVTRALQHDPQLPEKTWHKVEAVAKKLGYEPNAQARAMALRRRITRPVSEQGGLAILQDQSNPIPNQSVIAVRCRELGYQLEKFTYHSSDLSANRLTQILKARNIAGIFISPPKPDSPQLKRLKLDWSLFPSVVLGHSLFWPPLHRVTDNQFRNIRILIRKLARLGYQRIGLFVESKRICDPDNGWLGGYLAEMQLRQLKPSFCFREGNHYQPAAIRNWIQKERLDAIITDHEYAAAQIRDISNRKIPEELGIASLFVSKSGVSGIDIRLPQIEKAAVEFLVHLIHSHQRGAPKIPQRVLIDGAWLEGFSTRRHNSSADQPSRS